MNRKSDNLVTGSLWKGILTFSIPLIFSNLLQVFFNMADVATVGQFCGSLALGAIGCTTMIVSLFTALIIGVASGINVIVAKYLGAQDERGVTRTVHTALIVMLALGILIFLLSFFLSKYILVAVKTKSELLDLATLYLKIYFIGMPGLAIYNLGNAIYSAAGNTRRPLVFLSVAGVLNVGLNLFFVLVCHMSVDGVAWASAISQYVSAALILISLLLSKEVYGIRLNKIVVDKKCVKAILKIGIPSGFQNALFAIANMFLQSGVNSLDTVYVEGSSAAMNADTLVWDTMAAFYTAGASFIGQNYGAGKKDRILKSYWIAIIYSCGIALVLGGLLFIFGKPFLRIFSSDEEVVSAGYERLMIMALSYWISSFMDSSTASCRGLGKTFVPTIIVVTGSCIFRIAWIYTVFAYFKTIQSLCLLYTVSWTLTSIAQMIYFAYLYKHISVNLTPAEPLPARESNS